MKGKYNAKSFFVVDRVLERRWLSTEHAQSTLFVTICTSFLTGYRSVDPENATENRRGLEAPQGMDRAVSELAIRGGGPGF